MSSQAAKAAGWITEGSNNRLEHVGFGVVQGDDGKKFKTRSGASVRLVSHLYVCTSSTCSIHAVCTDTLLLVSTRE